MKIITRGSYEVKEETQHRIAITAVHKGEVFISHHQDRNVIQISAYNVESKECEMLFSFPMESKYVSYMTVSDKFVACVDKDTYTLKLYDRREKTVQTLPLPGLTHFICNIYFLQDGSLLATGGGNKGYLFNKYRISTKETDGEVITLIWSCPLTKACGIAVSDNEKLIFVCELEAKRIYVVRPDGKCVMSASLEYQDVIKNL
jgi:WD40 repeat protein